MGALSFQRMPFGGEPARFGDIRRFDELDSTNRLALELAAGGAPEGIIVVTDHQTAGRGRRGRTWSAPPHSALLASVLLRPALAPASAPVVAMAVALAAVDACGDVAGVRPALKWPNDLVDPTSLGKLAGLLAETMVNGDRLAAVVVGLGLNVTPAAATLAGAVCLDDLAGRPIDRKELLASWLSHLERRYAGVVAPGGVVAVLEAYRHGCATLGRVVRVELASGWFEGRAADVSDAGHLVVDTDTGRRQVSAGDVVHLRPAQNGVGRTEGASLP
ncbi:MAG TPA: biotin--[acetyl-CoA-carboxylase] ligase [Acidimicrobiales bacterium]|nr:biotin--[acetyl-CoA-carboxylase] ligase [Acidimicrobiales bacterium]